MKSATQDSTLTQPFNPVKPPNSDIGSSTSDSVRHHSNLVPKKIKGNREKVWGDTDYYGVSSYRRILTKDLFFKRYDRIRKCLEGVLGLTPAEREFTLRAARFGAYYGSCYAKISTLCQEPGCSEATAFRVLKKLKDRELVTVIPRYLDPYRRQISSLILFHNLFLLIAKYLAERGGFVWDKWLLPWVRLPWPQFWQKITTSPEARAGPGPPVFVGP